MSVLRKVALILIGLMFIKDESLRELALKDDESDPDPDPDEDEEE